jgi:hypothetical protein
MFVMDGNVERLELMHIGSTGGGRSQASVASSLLGVVLSTCCLNNADQISLATSERLALFQKDNTPVYGKSKAQYSRQTGLDQRRVSPIDDGKWLVLELECAQSDIVRSHQPTRKGASA